MIEEFTIKRAASLIELQQITGYLNFISTVVPLGRTFLRRLYNMQLYFPLGNRHCSDVFRVRPRKIYSGGRQR